MRCARFAISRFRWARIACLVATVGVGSSCDKPQAVTQPMAFNHKRHVEADVDCLTCHETAADAPAASLPALRVCAKCHKEVQGKDPAREQAILEAVKNKQEIPWVQVNRVAGHVYFSHRAHVGFAEMECDVCHGDMKAVEQAVTRPNAPLTMGTCMACHDKKGASNDCLACHQ